MALLWITGCLWLVLRYFYQGADALPHPMQGRLLMVHGVLALAAVFFFGWVAGSSIGESWWRRMDRVTGITLVTLLGLLTVTGVGNYYVTSDRLRSGMGLSHQLMGALVILPAVLYWLRGRKK